MRLHSPILLAFATVLGFAGTAPASDWTYRSGLPIPGEPVAYDGDGKVLAFRDKVSDRETEVPTRELSHASRRKLLCSPLFLKAKRETPFWHGTSADLLIVSLALFTVVLGLAFWFTAWYFTGKLNPLLTATAFLGSWIIIAILAVCYAFLLIRIDGGIKIILFGTAVALSVTPLYLSAVYNCTYGKGSLILLSHLLAGGFILATGVATIELVGGRKVTEAWWDKVVFEPLGLIETRDAGPPSDS